MRWSGIAAWLVGFATYQWIHPTGPSWWTGWLEAVPEAGELAIGSSLPAFAVSFVLYAVLRQGAPARQTAAARGR